MFLTQSVQRAYHILQFAAEVSRNTGRRLVYAALHQQYVTDVDPLFTPLFLDHLGNWQSLVDLHPTAPYAKMPVRLTRSVESPLAVC